MTLAPLVSIVVPMRNAAPYVRQTLESLVAQTYERIEVVVVDDGSNDGSSEIVASVRDPRVRIVDGPCRGISAAFNAGLAAARGSYVARCDADDLYDPPDRIARQMAWLEAHPEYVATCARFRSMDQRGRPIADLPGTVGDVTDALLQGRTDAHFCTFLVRAEALRAIGGCREWFVTAEDLDLQARIAARGLVWGDDVVAYSYRLHEASTIHTQDSPRRVFYEHCARSFAVERAASGVDPLMRGELPEPPSGGTVSREDTVRSQAQGHLHGAAWTLHQDGRWLEAIVTGARAAWVAPVAIGSWRNLAALVLKRPPSPHGRSTARRS